MIAAMTRSPQIGIVSLGCPKALVDSERILSRLRADGYVIADSYESADAVIVNTCGFLDSARDESLEAIGEALDENGRVIVTGCLGAAGNLIQERFPNVLSVSGPHQYEAVVGAVREAVPPPHNPLVELVPESGLKLTPRHYAYLKISEGCNNRCSFCIIPQLRGDLVSRPVDEVLREAEQLARVGVRELLVISQDTSAYGVDLRYAEFEWRGKRRQTRFLDLARGLAELGIWIRLHYVYPYPHVDKVVELMAEGGVLPYLDIPFQHASPKVLKAMRRPARQDRTLNRIRAWRDAVPDLTIRSTFIVGFPGEQEEDFAYLLDWLAEAQLDRVGCFQYEPVAGAAANELGLEPVADDVKQDRWERLMSTQQLISRDRLAAKIGQTLDVIVDEVDADGCTGRSKGDAPEIDGTVRILQAPTVEVGDIVPVTITQADEYDLTGRLT